MITPIYGNNGLHVDVRTYRPATIAMGRTLSSPVELNRQNKILLRKILARIQTTHSPNCDCGSQAPPRASANPRSRLPDDEPGAQRNWMKDISQKIARPINQWLQRQMILDQLK